MRCWFFGILLVVSGVELVLEHEWTRLKYIVYDIAPFTLTCDWPDTGERVDLQPCVADLGHLFCERKRYDKIHWNWVKAIQDFWSNTIRTTLPYMLLNHDKKIEKDSCTIWWQKKFLYHFGHPDRLYLKKLKMVSGSMHTYMYTYLREISLVEILFKYLLRRPKYFG